MKSKQTKFEKKAARTAPTAKPKRVSEKAVVGRITRTLKDEGCSCSVRKSCSGKGLIIDFKGWSTRRRNLLAHILGRLKLFATEMPISELEDCTTVLRELGLLKRDEQLGVTAPTAKLRVGSTHENMCSVR